MHFNLKVLPDYDKFAWNKILISSYTYYMQWLIASNRGARSQVHEKYQQNRKLRAYSSIEYDSNNLLLCISHAFLVNFQVDWHWNDNWGTKIIDAYKP